VAPTPEAFQQIGEATSLTTLKLNRYVPQDYWGATSPRRRGFPCAGIHHIASLTTLVVNDCALDDATLRAVGHHCTKLESVALFGNPEALPQMGPTDAQITDDGVAALAKGLAGSLKHFRIGGFAEPFTGFDADRPVLTATAACIVSVLDHCPNVVAVHAADLIPPRLPPPVEGHVDGVGNWARPWLVLPAGGLQHLERLTIYGGGAHRGRETGEGAGDAVS